MFALVSLTIQLTILAIRLTTIAVIWMVRLTVLLVAAIGGVSSVRGRDSSLLSA